MNGYETARRIREGEALGVKRRIPIVAMTASVLPENRQKCLASGMDDFVAKPINQDDLFNAVMRWLPTSTMKEQDTPGCRMIRSGVSWRHTSVSLDDGATGVLI